MAVRLSYLHNKNFCVACMISLCKIKSLYHTNNYLYQVCMQQVLLFGLYHGAIEVICLEHKLMFSINMK